MELKKSLTQHYRWLRKYGLNDSHSGNISAREDDHFWITPTGACADTLRPADFISSPVVGLLPPHASGDANLHQAIYQTNSKAMAVVHSHCPHAVALTLNGENFSPPDFEGQLYFPTVPVISVPYEVYFEWAAEQVAEALLDSPICIVQGHGVYAWGETLNLAYKWSCSLELSAKTAFIAGQAGTLSDSSN